MYTGVSLPGTLITSLFTMAAAAVYSSVLVCTCSYFPRFIWQKVSSYTGSTSCSAWLMCLIASTPSYVFAVYWVILPSLTTNNWCTVSVLCGTLKQDCWEATSQSVGTDTYLPARRGQYSHDYPAACYRRMEDGGWRMEPPSWEMVWGDRLSRGQKTPRLAWQIICLNPATLVSSHESNSHKINFHEVNSHQINFPWSQLPLDQLNTIFSVQTVYMNTLYWIKCTQ